MGWEKDSRYYVRKRRLANGQVTSEYVGGGILGSLAHLEDKRQREARIEQRAIERHALAEIDAAAAVLDSYRTLVRDLHVACLIATHHHQRKRQWRKVSN